MRITAQLVCVDEILLRARKPVSRLDQPVPDHGNIAVVDMVKKRITYA